MIVTIRRELLDSDGHNLYQDLSIIERKTGTVGSRVVVVYDDDSSLEFVQTGVKMDASDEDVLALLFTCATPDGTIKLTLFND